MEMQKGFTLIELIMVVVLLGILSAFAIPKYIDMRADAAQAAVNGVAGAMGAAMASNYAARTVNSAKGIAVTDCNTPAVLAAGALPTQGGAYSITAATISTGSTASCTLTFTPTGGTAVTATFTGMGISP